MKPIYKVILGTIGVPLTTIGALGYHIYHRHCVQTPDPLEVQVAFTYFLGSWISCTTLNVKLCKGFPDDTPEETKKRIILQRRKLIQDDKDTATFKMPVEEFLSMHAADDIEYEDHLRRWKKILNRIEVPNVRWQIHLRFKGREEVKCFMLDGAHKWDLLEDKLGKGVFHTQIHSEHHGPTESAIDKTITLSFK